MTIRVTCPHCGQQSSAPEGLGGKIRHCPQCGNTLVIPAAHGEPPAPEISPTSHTTDSHSPAPLTAPRKKSEHHDLIDMTAMVDIVFFLLIYFLVTSFVQLAAAIPAPATSAKVGRTARNNATPQPEGLAITVKIDADDVVWIEQDPVFSPAEVYTRLRSAREELEAERLRIAASSEATHGKMVLVLDAGVTAGFTSANLVLEESAP
jgi:biopolymer transport protein ExbD